MAWALVLLAGLGAAHASGDDALEAEVLEAAGQALEAAPGVPWTTAVLGQAGDIAGREDALLIVLDDEPSSYAGPGCESGWLPRICESRAGVIYCSEDAVRALIALDSGRGHPSVPLLHALAHELGHMAGAGPGLSADTLRVSLEGAPEQKVATIREVLERDIQAAPAEAEADAYADILLSRRLLSPPYDVDALSVHIAVLDAAHTALASAGACTIDEAPDGSPSQRDLARSARQLLCAASGDHEAVILAAFEGSHPDWPWHLRSLERTTSRPAPGGDPAAYYAAVAETLDQQLDALESWPPDCSPGAVEAFLQGFDDVPMVCPQLSAELADGDWTPAARIPVIATGDQLSVRGEVQAALVLESGRVGLVLPARQQVGIWTPGEPQGTLIRVPCTPTWVAEDGDGLLVACESPAGVAEIRGGRLRVHALSALRLGDVGLDAAGTRVSWIGRVDDRWWLTGGLSSGAGFGLEVTDWSPRSLAAWRGEGCEDLGAVGATRWWRADPEGDLHGVSTGDSPDLFRLSPGGALVGREDPSAWEAYAWDQDLSAGPVLACGPSYAQARSICVDSEGSTFDPVPDPLDFDKELSMARSLVGESPSGAICDTSAARFVLLHDANTPEQAAWVIRDDAQGAQEVLLRPNITRAALSCGPAGAAVLLGKPELSRVTWLK